LRASVKEALVERVVERVDRRAVPAQQRLAHAVEVDDHRGHRVALLCARRDRLTDKLVREGSRQLLHRDQALGRCVDRAKRESRECGQRRDESS